MTGSAKERRERVLGSVRTALAGGDDAARRRLAAARLSDPPAHMKPGRIDVDAAGLLALFRGFLEGQSATVLDIARAADVPAAIARYLRGANLPARIRRGADPWLAALPWGAEPALEVTSGRAAPDDTASVSRAVAGVAETGTLVLASGPDNPVTLTFLPETHIIVVGKDEITGSYEDAWAAIRARFGATAMPRTVNFVSGPSRTADIGGRLVTGAHGPRRLCVMVVAGA